MQYTGHRKLGSLMFGLQFELVWEWDSENSGIFNKSSMFINKYQNYKETVVNVNKMQIQIFCLQKYIYNTTGKDLSNIVEYCLHNINIYIVYLDVTLSQSDKHSIQNIIKIVDAQNYLNKFYRTSQNIAKSNQSVEIIKLWMLTCYKF